MLNIKINDYRITSDSNQIILNKVRKDENGEIKRVTDKNGNEIESVSVVGYYGTLSMCLRAVQRDYVFSEGTEIQSIVEYKRTLERITNEFELMTESVNDL